MQTCDNCKAPFDEAQEGVVAKSGATIAAAVCGGCTTGAKKIKLVLTRSDLGGFTYEQYTAIEMIKKAG